MFDTAKAMDRECVELPLTCKTRWWTLLRTARAVQRNLPQLRIVLSKERRPDRSKRATNYVHLIFTPEEEETLELLISLLTPLESITEELSSETYVTGSAVFTVIQLL